MKTRFCAAAATSLALLLAGSAAWCQNPAETQLISSEKLLPERVEFFLRVDADYLWNANTRRWLSKRIVTGDTLEELLVDLAAPQAIADVEQLILASVRREITAKGPPDAEQDEGRMSWGMVIVTSSQPIDPQQRLAAMQAKAGEQNPMQFKPVDVGRRRFYRSDLGSESVAFLSPRQFIVGEAEAIETVLRELNEPSPLSSKRQLWAGALRAKEPLAGGFDTGSSEEFRELLDPLPTPIYGAFLLGMGASTTAHLRVQFAQAPEASELLRVATELAMVELGVDLEQGKWKSSEPMEGLKREMIQSASPPTALLKAIEKGAGLQVTKFQLDGGALRCSLSLPITQDELTAAAADGAAVLAEAVIDAIDGLRFFFFTEPTDERPELAAEMKRVAVGLQRYQKQHGRLPPPAIVDENGAPLLSWRVALLPYVGEEKLYGRFRLNESWDSKHNLSIWRTAQEQTSVYRTGSGGRTKLRIFQAADSPFHVEPKQNADDPATTILVIQADRQAIWTQPETLKLLPDYPLPDLGAPTVEAEEPAPDVRVIHMIMADGSVRRLTLDMSSEDTQRWIRGAATAGGGELTPKGDKLDVKLTPRDPLEPPAPDVIPPLPPRPKKP